LQENKEAVLYPILATGNLTETTHLFKIGAPDVARKARAGQFVVIRIDEKGERIPLTLADWDKESVTLVVQEVGATTRRLSKLKVGEQIQDLIGPLGNATETHNFGTVVCVAGGVGAAPVYPIARSLKSAGNKVITILGARNKSLLFWEEKLRSVSDQMIVTTDDGSYGRKALVTEPLKEILSSGEKVGLVVAIGPSIMMKFVSLTTQPFGVKTIVSLNPIMVDGTGMCGCCRVSVGGVTKFSCVDGPDFDGNKVNWDELLTRQKTYLDEEKFSGEKQLHECKIQA
jgi:NAD(P)H-flavin reductase